MGNCSEVFHVENSSVLTNIAKEFGADFKGFKEFLTSTLKDYKLDGKFVPNTDLDRMYREKYSEPIDFNAENAKEVADRIKDIIYRKSLDPARTAKNKTKGVAGSLYTSYGDKAFIQNRVIPRDILKLYASVRFNAKNEGRQPKNKRDWYIKKVKNAYKNKLISRLNIQDKTNTEIIAEANNYEGGWLKYFYDKLGGEKMLPNDANLLATVMDMTLNSKKYFEEVFYNGELGIIKKEKTEDVDHQDDDVATFGISDIDGKDEYNNWAESVETGTLDLMDEDLKTFFNTIPKLISTEKDKTNNKYQLDKSNPIGDADYMDSSDVITTLYHRLRGVSSVDDMIAKIEEIANSEEGKQGFIIIADKMRKDNDMRQLMMRTFGKDLMYKNSTYINEDKVTSNITNPDINTRDALARTMFGLVRYTVLNTDHDYNNSRLKQVWDKLSENNVKKAVNAIMTMSSDDLPFADKSLRLTDAYEGLNDFSNILRSYYPNITDGAIERYLKSGENPFVFLNQLKDLLQQTIDAAKSSKNNYDSLRLELIKQHNVNHNLISKYGSKAKNHEEYVDETELRDALKNKDYLDENQNNVVVALADKFDKYMLGDVSNNSTNADGKNASDVADSNRITYLQKVISSDEAIKNLGDIRSKVAGSKYSNFLVEHRDKDGKIENFGLFTENNDGTYSPTDYAKDMLTAERFDGVANRNNNDSAVYSRMVQADYVTSAFINFFNPSLTALQSSQRGGALAQAGGSYGMYFMRTPSDAPKNFEMIMPKYGFNNVATGDLLKIEDNDKIENEVNDLLGKNSQGDKVYNTAKKVQSKQVAFDVSKSSAPKLTRNELISILKNHSPKSIKITNESVRDKIHSGRIKPVDGRYKIEFNVGKTDDVILSGKYDLKTNNLSDIKYEGVDVAFTEEFVNWYRKELYNLYTEAGEIKREINKEHPIFKQYKRAFIQELTDASEALGKFFELNDDGSVALDFTEDGKAIPRVKAGIDINDPLSNHGTETYHFKLDKQNHSHFWEDNPDSSEPFDKVRLTGQVFHSNRFKLFIKRKGDTEEREHNYAEEGDMKQAFNLLYGGADDSFIHTERSADGSHVMSVNLTKAQDEAVNKMINDYVVDMVDQAYNTFKDYKKFIRSASNINMSYQNIAEFMTNYNLAYYTFDEMFEGSSKFYGTAQDFLKRAKESQAGGDPYGVSNYYAPLDAEKIALDVPFAKFNHIDAYGKSRKFNVTPQNKFTAVTIYNTVRTDENTIKRLAKLWNDASGIKYSEDGSDKNIPRLEDTKAYKTIYENHKNLKTNDAQSFITFEEWIRRIAARGQFNKYKPLIDRILDETKPINANDIGQFVQVQKNFYYDLHYNSDMGMIEPRQIKNAEYVLIPRFIKGTELERVYNIMKFNKIDQLNTRETTKAGKENVLRLWDDNGDLTKDNIKNFANNVNSAKSDYDYNFLYTQQETVQHTNTDNKISVQIVKKIVDNIPKYVAGKENPLYHYKKDFFNTYTEKIHRSFVGLCKELDIPIDDKGHLDLDENGDIKGVNYEKLFTRLRQEATRNGMDSNLLDYFSMKDGQITGVLSAKAFNAINTKMPLYMSNMSAKTQSVVNAVFNSSITRQKINGFHCAQVTNIGFRRTKKDIHTSTKLKYHEDADLTNSDKSKRNTGTMEIAMTYSAFGVNTEASHYKKLYNDALNQAMNELGIKDSNNDDVKLKTKDIFDSAIIKELEAEGLDKVIAYRIPTEGKQSMTVAKIAHFLDDAQGSTIIVPDEWVAQTGSDFDIDSVYGIQHKSYIDKLTGQVHKIQYKKKGTFTDEDYNRYVLRNSNLDKNDVSIKNEVDAEKEARKAYKDLYRKLQDETSASYRKLPKYLKSFVQSIDSQINEGLKKNPNFYNGDKQEEFIDRLKNKIVHVGEYRDKLKGKVSEDIINDIDNFIKSHEILLDYVEGRNETKPEGTFKDAIEKLKTKRNKIIDDTANTLGLKSRTEWLAGDEKTNNDDQALNNNMVDDMIKILQDPSQAEENLSSSTFANITAAQNKVQEKGGSAIIAAERKARSPYNFLDQAKYMNDVMSGARLKAFSVTRDTFCSVCNTVKPILSKDNHIIINYGGDKGVREHYKYGWEDDNKNVDGYLITAYSSQTSAHAFDAVKNGAVPNVNEYTFAAYKLFPEIGSNYDAAISFIMQPGITRIVDAYDSNKSVFLEENRNPIHEAIRSIAEDLHIKNADTDPIDSVINQLNEQYGDTFRKIFNTKDNISLIDTDIKDIEFNVEKQFERCQDKPLDSFDDKTRTDKLVYDLGTILQFNRLNGIAQKITDIARVCNPDKFGAKQTIFSTNKVFDDIHEMISKGSGNVLEVERNEDEYIKVKKGKDAEGKDIVDNITTMPFLEAVYPGIYGTLDSYLQGGEDSLKGKTSRYSILNTFLRYATGTSLKVARPLFKTQTPKFRNFINGLDAVFDKTRPVRIDEKTYNDFERYTLSTFYQATPIITAPVNITFDANKGAFTSFKLKDNYNDADVADEMERINGYNRGGDIVVLRNGERIPFEVEDVNHPTEQELNDFVTLTPAQKVAWIKAHGDKGIFARLTAELNNNYKGSKRKGRQTIRLKEDIANPETLYHEFDDALHNDNPFIANTALDLIKYAFVVEGYKPQARGITKIIKNTALYQDSLFDFAEKDSKGEVSYHHGEPITETIDGKFLTVSEPHTRAAMNDYEEFVRSHSDMRQLPHTYMRKIGKFKKQIDLSDDGDGLLHVDTVGEDNIKKLKNYKIALFDDKGRIKGLNKYVVISNRGNRTIYKIVSKLDPEYVEGTDKNLTTRIYLVPLNKLDANEHGEWSANPANNEFASQDAYMKKIHDLESTYFGVEKFNIDTSDYHHIEKEKTEDNGVDYFNLNTPNSDPYTGEIGEFANVIKRANEFFKDPNHKSDTLYIPSYRLHYKFHKKGRENAIVQTITDDNGVKYDVDIFKPNLFKFANAVFSGRKKVTDSYIPDGYKDILAQYQQNGWSNVDTVLGIALHRDMQDTIKEDEATKLSDEVVSEDTSDRNQLSESAIQDIDETASSSPVEENVDKTDFSDNTTKIAEEPIARQRDRIFETSLRALYNEIRRSALRGNEEAERIKRRFDRKGISGYRGNLNIYSNDIINGAHKFVLHEIQQIQNELNHFAIKDGEYVSITDPYVMDKIKNNVDFRNKYLDLILRARSISDDKHLGILKDIDVKSQDPIIQNQITDIVNALDNLNKDKKIKDAFIKFGNDYLDKISNNYLIQDDLLSVLDGYYANGFIESYISDLQDSANPMIQIVTKEVMSDIRSAELKGQTEAVKWINIAKGIMDEARKNGTSCDWKDIIDDYGRLRQKYSKDYLNDYFKLNDEISDAKATYGEYSIQAIKALLKRKKWLAANTEQEIVTNAEARNSVYNKDYDKAVSIAENYTEDEFIDKRYRETKYKKTDKQTAKFYKEYTYYKNIAKQDRDSYINDALENDPLNNGNKNYYELLNDLEEKIINQAPNIYQKYVQKTHELQNLIDKRTNIINDELENQIDKKRKEIKGLTRSWEYNEEGIPVEKSDKDARDADALHKYIIERRKVQHGVYEDKIREGWEEELQNALAVIDQYERRDTEGNLITDRVSLSQDHPDYANALKWIQQHATIDVTIDEDNPINAEYARIREEHGTEFDEITDPVERALKEPIQYVNKNKTKSYPRNVRDELRLAYALIRGKKQERYWYKKILDRYKTTAKDEFGEIDASKFSDKDIASIKKHQEYEYGDRLEGDNSDKRILNNAKSDGAVYIPSFFDGMSSGGELTAEYIKAVNDFNNFAIKFWDPNANVLHTSEMTVEELKEMNNLLTIVENTRRKENVDVDESKRAKKFREERTETVPNWDTFNEEADKAYAQGDDYYNEWLEANAEWDINGDGHMSPRNILYSTIRPKAEYMNKYLAKNKTRALKVIHDSTETTTTSAWRRKVIEMRKKNRDDEETHHIKGDKTYKSNIWNDWYNKNTVWNPYSHTREPLRCWVTSRVKSSYGGEYVPKTGDIIRKVKDEYVNKKWHKGSQGKMIGVNYKYNEANSKYSSHLSLNEHQQKLYDHVYKMMDTLVKEDRARDYIRNGQLPAASAYKEEEGKLAALKTLKKEVGKFVGLNNGKTVDNNQPDFNYDVLQSEMPMLQLLQKTDVLHKELVYPERQNFVDGPEGDAKFRKAQLTYHEDKRKRDEEALNEHKELISKDWGAVFQRFIQQAYRYNSIANNKEMLLYCQKFLEGNNIYARNEVTGKFKYDSTMSSENNPQYVKVRDNRLLQQYNNWVKRLYLDIWKEPTSQKINRLASRFQNLTSSVYMMLNVRGGISNVTTGLTNIAAEAFARDYFNFSDWAKGNKLYNAAIPDYIGNMFNPDVSDTLQGALIKTFNIVDFDELNGLVKIKDEKTAMDTIRDLMFSTNSAGEHYMQNTALLTMLNSHRLIRETPENIKNGKPKYKLCNQAEYTGRAQELVLNEYLRKDKNRSKDWIKFKLKIANNPQKARRIMQFRENLITMFAMSHLSKAEQEQFGKDVKAKEKELSKDFNDDKKNPTLWSQFELGSDRKAHFKANSILSQLDGTITEGQKVSDAYRLIGQFKERVISVNKKIHGYYDKMSQAQIENQWWGSLVMQYHKHIYPGMAKAWRRQGFYNETRGTVEKGRYVSAWDFIRLPIDAMKYKTGMDENDANAVKGIQNVCRNIVNYATNLKLCWNLLPQYERNNVRRMAGFSASILSAFFAALALRMIQDDENKNSIMFNLALYEADRLASESSQTNPIGVPTNFKTLWSQPIAATSIADDLISSVGELGKMIIEGDDYQGEYTNGQYAHMNKLGVMLGRRIPIFRQYQSLSVLPSNNKAYRIGDNTLTFMGLNPTSIAENIRGIDLKQ